MPVIYDMYDKKTLNIIGGSDEYLFVNLYALDSNSNVMEPLILDNVNEIEWRLAKYSVLTEKKRALIILKLSKNEIYIIRDSNNKPTNRIQIGIKGIKTLNYSGGFVYQTIITDGNNNTFIPLQGIIVIDELIPE